MGTKTKINWCDHTFNPWRGCTPAEPSYGGCDHCYARAWAKRNPAIFGTWGPDGKRVIANKAYWQHPIAWNRAARRAGERRRVFCGSLMDFWEDRPELVQPRLRTFRVISETPWLDWLLLTKRPESAALHEYWTPRWFYGLVPDWDEQPWPPHNVWLGATTENQPAADARISVLLQIPAALRFLSIEPMLSPVDLSGCMEPLGIGWVENIPTGPEGGSPIDLVIVGGESGPNCRPFEWDWARSLRDQCRGAGTAFWMKQGGGHSKKRDRLEDLPEDVRIRELPR